MKDNQYQTSFAMALWCLIKFIYEMAEKSGRCDDLSPELMSIFSKQTDRIRSGEIKKGMLRRETTIVCDSMRLSYGYVSVLVERMLETLKQSNWEIKYVADPESANDALFSWFCFFDGSDLKDWMLRTSVICPFQNDFLSDSSVTALAINDIAEILTEKTTVSEVTLRWQQRFDSEYAVQKARLESATTYLKK